MNAGRTQACRLSVVILTYNEEVTLPECVESLQGLDCEVFVVDSGSTDRTVELARAVGATVVEHPFENYAAQRNWAQQHLPLWTEWVLHLDADERLTPALVTEIREVLREPPDGIEGFFLRKRTIFMGRWIKHGGHYPSYHLRLFRVGRGMCEDRLYDQHFLVNGGVAALRYDCLDVVTPDLDTWTVRHARWARLEAAEMLASQNSGNRVRPAAWGNPVERRRWLRERVYARSPLFARALLYWIYRYFARLGFLDGVEGLIFHSLHGFWYRLLVDATIYESRRWRPSGAQMGRRGITGE